MHGIRQTYFLRAMDIWERDYLLPWKLLVMKLHVCVCLKVSIVMPYFSRFVGGVTATYVVAIEGEWDVHV